MKIAPGPLIEDLRGSCSNLAIQMTIAGLTARYKNQPVQPKNIAQVLVRAAVASIAQTWKSPAMTDFRPAWIILANNNPYYDVWGVPHKMTGSAMFTKLNKNLNTLGLSMILPAPTALSCGSPLSIAQTHAAGPPQSFIITSTGPPAIHEAVVIRCSKPLSPGISTLANTQSIIQTFPAGTNSPWDISTAWNKKHATVTPGDTVFFLVNYVNTITGFAGPQLVALFNW